MAIEHLLGEMRVRHGTATSRRRQHWLWSWQQRTRKIDAANPTLWFSPPKATMENKQLILQTTQLMSLVMTLKAQLQESKFEAKMLRIELHGTKEQLRRLQAPSPSSPARKTQHTFFTGVHRKLTAPATRLSQ